MKNIKPKEINNIHERKWFIPYMGDASYVAAAALRHFNLDSSVMQTYTGRGEELSTKHIQNEVCYPLRVVTGDILNTLEKEIKEKGRDFVENNCFILLPTASGPCRFGKYQEIIRTFMDEEGYSKIPIGGPSSTTDYGDILNSHHNFKDRTLLQKILMKGIIATDLLDDVTLRVRPYSSNKKGVENLKQERLGALEEIIEAGADTSRIKSWGVETANSFSDMIETTKRFPLVIYAGEIYMRQHDLATGNVIQKLEEEGLEVVRSPIIEWIEYINQVSRIDTWTQIKRDLYHFDFAQACENSLKLSRQNIKGKYMHFMNGLLSAPFKEILRFRHDMPSPLNLVQSLERKNEFHSHIRGEAALSIGIADYLMNGFPRNSNSVVGMFHVGPFTCMQEGVAKSKIESIKMKKMGEDQGLIFPIIHASFGESPNPNLNSEIAIFKEQCYQRREMISEKR